jgi:hypothetical protein
MKPSKVTVSQATASTETTEMGEIRTGLERAYPRNLVTELLDAYREAKESFYLGGLRLSEVEGGRFCEAAYRLLEHRAFGAHTPIGTQLDTDGLARRLANVPASDQPDAIRLHIPRGLRMVYDIRNKRDAAHLGDGIDPNDQDASLVTGILDWVLAEFVRLHHDVDADRAQQIVAGLVARRVPIVEDFDGFLKILRPDLGARDRCLVLLVQRGRSGATLQELSAWVPPPMRKNLKRTMLALVDDKTWVHEARGRFYVTRSGIQEVERRQLIALSGTLMQT